MGWMSSTLLNKPHIASDLPAVMPEVRSFSSIPNVVSSSKTRVEPGTVETKPNLRDLPVSSIYSQPEDCEVAVITNHH